MPSERMNKIITEYGLEIRPSKGTLVVVRDKISGVSMVLSERMSDEAIASMINKIRTDPPKPIERKMTTIHKKIETNPQQRNNDIKLNSSGGCSSCQQKGLLFKLKNIGTSFVDIIKYFKDPKVEESEYNARKEICSKCEEKDTGGIKLFRETENGIFTCGNAFAKHMLRDPKKDGCGCILNAKWAGSTQKCPLDKW